MTDKLITIKQAASLINDNSTVATTALGLHALPQSLLKGIQKRYESNHSPKNLTFICAGGLGDGTPGSGLDILSEKGLLKKVIISHISLSPTISKAILNNQLEAYFFPQGVITKIYQSTANNSPGHYTKIGLNTFIDPRVQAGQSNEISNEEMVDLVEIDGEEWLKYPNLPIDVAFIKGTYADENGNISADHEVAKFEALSLAMSTKKNGGIVIAQVENRIDNGEISPKNVLVPSMLVDYIVLDENPFFYNPDFTGERLVSDTKIEQMPLNVRKVIARRAAMELKKDDIVNLGFGIPAGVASVAQEEEVYRDILFTIDTGVIGGVPSQGIDYGGVYNPQAMIPHNDMMDFYNGGGLDIAILSFGQVDQKGNVNVSRLGDKIIGPGGFIDIVQPTKRVIFVGTFMRGAKFELVEKELSITEQGDKNKFLKEIDQVTFSTLNIEKNSQEILYVTERAVFDLHKGQIRLIEIAPGMDIEKDILANMEFKPMISENLTETDNDIYKERWGRLKEYVHQK